MTPLTDARRSLFEAAFVDGHLHDEKYADTGVTQIVFRTHDAAKPVRTKGGQLEVGGCLFPANRSLPAGDFSVQAATGAMASAPQQARTAYARIVFTAGEPVRWEQMRGQIRSTSSAIGSDAVTEQWVGTEALRVDGGGIAIAEPGFGERLEQLMAQHDLEPDEVGEYVDTIEEGPVLQTSQLEGKVSVAMLAGMGDGTYGVYAGYDAQNVLTRLLVDFDLFA